MYRAVTASQPDARADMPLVMRHIVFSQNVRKYADFPLAPNKSFTFGRKKGSNFSFRHEEDALVSKTHAELAVDRDGNVTVKDLATMNGTFVNDSKIPSGEPVPLKKGDVVSFGTSEKLLNGETSLSFLLVEMADEASKKRKRPQAQASALVDALIEELTCCVCTEAYVNPVLIECGHSFCEDCLCTWYEKSTTPHLTCPQCRRAVGKREGPCVTLGRAMRQVVERVLEPAMSSQELAKRAFRVEIMENKKRFVRMRKRTLSVECVEGQPVE